MVIIWSKPAIHDLEDFKSYTFMTPENLKKYILDLFKSIDALSISPFLGKELFICHIDKFDNPLNLVYNNYVI